MITPERILKSPLNYTGGKAKLLPQILPFFPETVSTFVDIFAGGLNVTLNVEAERYIANDISSDVIGIYKYFQSTSEPALFADIEAGIAKYNLTKQNEEGYRRLRDDYNRNHSPHLLFLLVCYGFNHQIRFNSDGMFNIPFGRDRSSFNKNTENNLRNMLPILQKVEFCSLNFREFDTSTLKQGDFVYADPPYLISCAAYNDGKRGTEGWNADDDQALFGMLDSLDRRGIKFAMSNVIHHKGMTNQPLIDWADKYRVHHLKMDYAHSNYQANKSDTVEVLVCN